MFNLEVLSTYLNKIVKPLEDIAKSLRRIDSTLELERMDNAVDETYDPDDDPAPTWDSYTELFIGFISENERIVREINNDEDTKYYYDLLKEFYEK